MDIKDLTVLARSVPVWVWLAGAVLVLVVLAVAVRRFKSDGWAVLSTVIGLGWTSQGMWQTATGRYQVAPALAAVLFFLFESMMVAQMTRAHRFRADLPRRARFIAAVWTIAVVMGVIVALAEGLAQAPLRLAVPLLVAYTWWLGLTADDDPAARLSTSWRWTPREVGLRLGLLRAGRRDAHEVDRDYLVARMRALAFAHRYGWSWLDAVARRRVRLARLAMLADEGVTTAVFRSLAAADAVMTGSKQEAHDESPPTAEAETPPVEWFPERRPQGVHSRSGQLLRGAGLQRDAVDLVLGSVTPDRPYGMSNTDLARQYTPPLGERKSQEFGAQARRRIRQNGHAVR